MTPGASVIRVRNPDGKYADIPFTGGETNDYGHIPQRF